MPVAEKVQADIKKPKSKKYTAVLMIVTILLLCIVGISYFVLSLQAKNDYKTTQSQDTDDKNTQENISDGAIIVDSNFAQFKEIQVNVVPKIPPYTPKPDLSNVTNLSDFYLSEEAKTLLAKNAFVVTPGYYGEFFPLYEAHRYGYIPNFVTTDSILHNYHLMFDFILKSLEEQKFAAHLKQLNKSMLESSINQYNELKGTEWENAALRNIGFFAVGSKLLDPQIIIPAIIENEVKQELALIETHDKIDESPVMNIGNDEGTKIDTPQGTLSLENLKEDYTQYIPRGHYDKSDLLKAYFKSMMWYGRLTFRLKEKDAVKSAILITMTLDKTDSYNIWNKIFEPVNFFVGKSDDITFYEFKQIAERVYTQMPTTQILTTQKDKFDQFIEETKTLDPPQINSMPIFESQFQSNREEEIKGFRFMGQRFTIDASIFQRLIYREVGDKTTSCPQYEPSKTGCQTGARCLPKALDIPATLGSKEAKNILTEMEETKFACYTDNMGKMNSYVSGLPTSTWTQNLYWGWLYQLRPLLEEKHEGYPVFMQNQAWIRKDLNTFLGSWSELKHDTILYAKQTYAELGAGMPEEKDDRGYVEPQPLVYARLASLLDMTIEGLESRDLLDVSTKDNLGKMRQLAVSLKTISEKELSNEKLSDEEYELIRSYGGQLEHFWIEVNKNEPEFQNTSHDSYLNENPAVIISDVATDPNGTVLEVGTGKISNIYVIVPIDGQLRIAHGGVYSYYEFEWPMDDRLTDKKWREILDTSTSPSLPEWTNVFTTRKK